MRHTIVAAAPIRNASSWTQKRLVLATLWSCCCGCVSTLAEDLQKSGPNLATNVGENTEEMAADGWSAIVEMNPAAGATDVALDVDVRLTFDRQILAGEGAIRLHETINQAEVETVQIGDDRISIDDRTLVVAWDTELSPATGYYVYIAPGALVDEGGQPFAGVTDPDAYRFATRGPERLRLTRTVPADGESGVLPDTGLSFTFNQSIVAGLEGNITVAQANTDQTPVRIPIADGSRVVVNDDTLEVRLDGMLAYDQQYRVTVDAGTVQSTGGSAFDGLDVSNPLTFTTMPPPALTLVGTVPKDDETNVDPTSSVVFTFAEQIVPGNGAITVHQAQDDLVVEKVMIGDPNVVVSGVTLSIDLTSDLDTSTEYYVTADEGVVLSAEGAVFAGVSKDTDFSFTTADETATPLTLLAHAPETGDVEVPPTSELTLVFSEPVAVGSGTLSVFSDDDDDLVEVIDVASASAVSIGQDTVAVVLPRPLAPSTRYYVTVGAGSFRSVSGASFAGITDKDAWYFTTETVFGIEETAPVDDATGVPSTADLEITFSDDVVIGSGNLELRRANDDTLVESVVIDSPRVRAEGRTVSVELNTVLGSEVEYYVLIDGSAISSASGESWAGLSDEMRWNFTTEAVDFPAGTGAGLVLWFDAAYSDSIVDDGGVAIWADRSGKHNDLSQSNDDARPGLVLDGIAGKPAVAFDGGDALVGTNLIDMTAYDGFIVWQSNVEAGTDKATLFANDRSTQVNHGHPYSISQDAAQACVGQNCPDNSGWFIAKFEPPPQLDRPNLWNWGFDAVTTTIFARVNGSAPINQSGPTMTPWAPETPPMLGNCATPPCGFEGKISEVVVYARTLSPTERIATVDYLRQKWGFARPSCGANEKLGPNGSCYHLGTDPVDWATARTTCQSRGLGWDLATVRSQAEHEFVMDLLEVETAIGATDADVNGTWRWVTDTSHFWTGDDSGAAINSSFAAWESGEPSAGPGEACARYRQTDSGQWRWADYVCSNAQAYLCEGPAN